MSAALIVDNARAALECETRQRVRTDGRGGRLPADGDRRAAGHLRQGSRWAPRCGAGQPTPYSKSCASCGAAIEFAPGTNALRCPYCGHEQPLPQSTGQVSINVVCSALLHLVL